MDILEVAERTIDSLPVLTQADVELQLHCSSLITQIKFNDSSITEDIANAILQNLQKIEIALAKKHNEIIKTQEQYLSIRSLFKLYSCLIIMLSYYLSFLQQRFYEQINVCEVELIHAKFAQIYKQSLNRTINTLKDNVVLFTEGNATTSLISNNIWGAVSFFKLALCYSTILLQHIRSGPKDYRYASQYIMQNEKSMRWFILIVENIKKMIKNHTQQFYRGIVNKSHRETQCVKLLFLHFSRDSYMHLGSLLKKTDRDRANTIFTEIMRQSVIVNREFSTQGNCFDRLLQYEELFSTTFNFEKNWIVKFDTTSNSNTYLQLAQKNAKIVFIMKSIVLASLTVIIFALFTANIFPNTNTFYICAGVALVLGLFLPTLLFLFFRTNFTREKKLFKELFARMLLTIFIDLNNFLTPWQENPELSWLTLFLKNSLVLELNESFSPKTETIFPLWGLIYINLILNTAFTAENRSANHETITIASSPSKPLPPRSSLRFDSHV